MAQQNAELEKKAENIARQATKIYPKSSANTVVLTPVTTSQGHTLSVVKMDHDLLGSGQNVATTPPHQSHSHGLGSALPSQSSHSAKKAEKVRKTPPHILKAKKEYYQHNRETILSKQKEYKKRIATGVKKKVEIHPVDISFKPSSIHPLPHTKRNDCLLVPYAKQIKNRKSAMSHSEFRNRNFRIRISKSEFIALFRLLMSLAFGLAVLYLTGDRDVSKIYIYIYT